VSYLILFLVAAGFAMIPLPLFPSWIVVAYLVVEFDLRLWLAIFIGALGTTVGRVILVAVSRVAGHRMLGRWSQDNLDYLHKRIEGAAGDMGIAVLLGASPPPAGVLFILAGLMRVQLWLVAASVFIGRTIGYWISVGGTSLAAEPLANQLRDVVGPWSVALAVLIIAGVLVLALRIDYRALLEDRKFRLHRGRR
jgi:membrane protein YqaA with SNARE-associated domain